MEYVPSKSGQEWAGKYLINLQEVNSKRDERGQVKYVEKANPRGKKDGSWPFPLEDQALQGVPCLRKEVQWVNATEKNQKDGRY